MLAGPVAARGHVNGRGPQAQRSGRDERSEVYGGYFTPESNVRSWNSEVLEGWTAEREVLTEEEIREETVMLGLRTSDGIPERYPGLVPSDVPGRWRIPEEKWFTADDIISSLL